MSLHIGIGEHSRHIILLIYTHTVFTGNTATMSNTYPNNLSSKLLRLMLSSLNALIIEDQRVEIPIASMEELMAMHTSWDVLSEHCKLFVSFGGVPHKNSQINAGGATLHHVKAGLFGMREKGVRFVNVTPTADDLDTGGAFSLLSLLCERL